MAKDIDPAVASRVPPGQQLTTKWPVLTYGRTPRFDPARWTFRCFGLVQRGMTWRWDECVKRPRGTGRSDVHRVSRRWWLDTGLSGVPPRAPFRRARQR